MKKKQRKQPKNMNRIEEYKRKKAMEGKPAIMYVIESRRDGVKLHEREILSFDANKYRLNEFPYEVELQEVDDVQADHGYASGFGDLWQWSYYSTVDKELAIQKFEEETKRVYDKYQDPNRPPEELIIPMA